MLSARCVSTSASIACVGDDAQVPVIDLHHPLVVEHVHALAAQPPGNALVVAVGAQLDVVVELHLQIEEFLELPAHGRQWLQSITLDLLEELAP